MKLSVIIVNYNVEHFLEQCLHSVYKADCAHELEVFVVDNASVDGSLDMLQSKFPQVHLIANKDNVGFSKANNQGIEQSTGEYVLLLNPDTLVQEDTFEETIAFMDAHQDAGGLGVMMLDGNGNFLPESKRGLPTPQVAFHKIFGLSRLFPKSEKFNRYHLGHLDKNDTHEIEILSGAFMFMRRSALDKVGLLDEEFFMYGEDIDLSYRLTLGGYKNYYTARTRIIHYKGESTKKSSINYVFVFYNAMIIFAKKHFSDKNARLFSFFINLAIYFRAAIALMGRAVKTLTLPLLDGLIIMGLLYLTKNLYQDYSGKSFPELYYLIAFPIYSLIWVLSMAVNGTYMKPMRLKNMFIGMVYGSAIILILYSLVSDEYRFSRAMILLGSVASIFGLLFFRWILGLVVPSLSIGRRMEKVFALVGEEAEVGRVQSMLSNTDISESQVVHVHSASDDKEGFVGSLGQLKDIIGVYKVTDVIFCAKDISAEKIMDQMTGMDDVDVSFKIAPPESMFIIGSDSAHNSGELLAFDLNSVAKRENRHNKRILDFTVSLITLALCPLLIFIQRKPLGFIPNIFSVMFGLKTWVSYHPKTDNSGLPKLKNGILLPSPDSGKLTDDQRQRSNVLYSKDYSSSKDLHLIMDQIRSLGN
jgi:GT2 family glycosyltransferase